MVMDRRRRGFLERWLLRACEVVTASFPRGHPAFFHRATPNTTPMSEKYPESTGRRRFVTGVVGGAGLTAAGGAGGGVVDALTPPSGEGGGPVAYYGVENVAGPAPRPMPQVPLTVEDDALRGVWPDPDGDGSTVELGGVTYGSRWFQYCGLQAAEAVEPAADRDPTLRHVPESDYGWQRDLDAAGEPLRVAQFDDYREWGNGVGAAGLGKPATAYWRGDDPEAAIPVQVVRSERVAQLAAESEWLAASTAEGFLAYVKKCTHFCCVPGFKQYPSSRGEGAEDLTYCPCHQSAFDPFSVVRATYAALPRPPD